MVTTLEQSMNLRRLELVVVCLSLAARSLAAQAAPSFINPPGLSTPKGYTHAVVVPSGSRLVVISGQVALDSAGQIVGAGNMTAQATQVFENLKRALAGVGATWKDVVKLNTYVTSMGQSQAFRDVRDKYVNTEAPPASTLIEVRRLFRDEFVVEVEAIVAIPEK
jgi:enamine deaminase RidA (YjgF/YER057c/UK114 family)